MVVILGFFFFELFHTMIRFQTQSRRGKNVIKSKLSQTTMDSHFYALGSLKTTELDARKEQVGSLHEMKSLGKTPSSVQGHRQIVNGG